MFEEINEHRKALPWRCQQHPNAEILYTAEKHTWFWYSWEKYECVECGLKLKPDKKGE